MATGLGGAIATPFNRFLQALQHKDYLTLWTANLCAGAAAWALIAARAVLADEFTELYLWVGVVTFAAMIPRVFSTVITGFLADRFNRQTVLQWTYTLNLAHNIVLALLVMVGLANIWWLVGLSLLNGTLRSAQMTTTQSLVPNLVPRDVLPNAIALNEATQQGSRFLGGMVWVPGGAVLWQRTGILGLRRAVCARPGAGGPHRHPFHWPGWTPGAASSVTWRPALPTPTAGPACWR